GELVDLGDIARMSLDEEPAAVCHLHHGVIVEAGIDHQRFDIFGHLHLTVDMSLDVMIETVADDPASLSSSLVDRPPVATIVGDVSHPVSAPEELRTEAALRVGEGRPAKSLPAKSPVGRPETRCRAIGVSVQVKGSIDRSMLPLHMIIGSAEYPLLPVPSVTAGIRGQASVARARDELGHILPAVEDRRQHSGS